MSCQGEKLIYFRPNTNLLIAHLLAITLDKIYFKCFGKGKLNLISKMLILSKKIGIEEFFISKKFMSELYVRRLRSKVTLIFP